MNMNRLSFQSPMRTVAKLVGQINGRGVGTLILYRSRSFCRLRSGRVSIRDGKIKTVRAFGMVSMPMCVVQRIRSGGRYDVHVEITVQTGGRTLEMLEGGFSTNSASSAGPG